MWFIIETSDLYERDWVPFLAYRTREEADFYMAKLERQSEERGIDRTYNIIESETLPEGGTKWKPTT
jgi:hypothetical protein